MAGAEDGGLNHETDHQKQAPLPEAILDERSTRERHCAEERLFPEAGLE